ncbi:TonB-linked outer membrane protein, SusC/RagA family [Galbibacter orientalis DSM 19592]|uniref:TonB-linked outer membrane protein, SusC/RagA family n=1 Tax=Galbibacter orientalis DSM 19592 TaxID=926559 RepID=I3CAV6_9FLAO|nr:TonB-dependent receptor [Galbibacter orientalis]EIJ40749.1 TonB-linked outer membrane protein, SusC/RagA family [Galbibacter orientalis DSM 19592]
MKLTKHFEKRKIKYKYVWCLFFFFGIVSVNAQTNSVNGVVTDTQGPLPGVNVILKGTTNGVTTDFDGNFEVSNVSQGDVLVFSYLGFKTKEVTVASFDKMSVTMEEDTQALDEVVVIGYGTQKKSDLTGSVGQVEGDDIEKYTYSDASQALQGRMAGVNVEANGGTPGANAIVTIRGSSTLSDAGPLYVIDGMFTDNMNSLNPSDIESISVLKDASAAAIYGSRAANGVIIVTTKKGKVGKVGIDVDYSYGFQEVANKLDWANARQYADIVNRARDNDGNPRFPANDSQFNPNIDSDIQEESLRTAPILNANARIYGGSENLTYSLSLNHLDQEGIIKESSFQRTTVRSNGTFNLGKFKLESTIGLTRSENNPNNYFGKERDLLPTINIYDENGDFNGSDIPDVPGAPSLSSFYGIGNIANSLGTATLEDRTVKRNTVLGSIAASYEIVDGLTYKLNLGLDSYADNNYTFTPSYYFNAGTYGNEPFAELRETNTNYISTLIENTLTYAKTFGKHNINLIGGYTDQVINTRYLGVVARKFPSNDIRVASAAEDRAEMPSADLTKGIRSYFGRLSYSFDSRYLLTATIRRDGSSLFKEDLRWGTFPSVALGWNISNEEFMKDVTFITNLKLRASYGEVGSDNVNIYSISPELNLNSEYPIGDDQHREPGYSITKGVNDDITWETSKTTDIGLEFATLNNRLKFTMDYFNKNSEDVLVELALPLYTGFGNRVPFNTASITNKGFEFLTSYAQSFGDFMLNVSGNFTLLDNEVTALGDATPIIEGGFTSNGLKSTRTDVGQPVSSFYGYVRDGIYQTDAEAAAANDAYSPQAGDIRFKDLNGDGQVDSDDQTYLGSPAPDIQYGFNITAQYRGFDLNLFFNGVAGNKILNSNLYRGYFDTEGNYLAGALNAWTPTNTDTNIPRNTQIDPGFNRRMSDFYLENGDYFRLRNMQIGYTLPSEISEQMKMAKLRLYFSASNVFTITDYTGYYPEVGRNTRGESSRIFSSGVDEGSYPTARSFQLGLQVSF